MFAAITAPMPRARLTLECMEERSGVARIEGMSDALRRTDQSGHVNVLSFQPPTTPVVSNFRRFGTDIVKDKPTNANQSAPGLLPLFSLDGSPALSA